MEKIIKGVIISILALAVGAIIFSLGGCKPVEKYKASPQFAEDCADKFPVKETIVTIPGKEIRDTVDHWIEVDCSDTIEIRATDIEYVPVPRIVKAKCPPSITIYRTDTVIKTEENTARVKVLSDKLRDLQAENDTWKGKAKKRFWWLIIVIAAVGGWTFRHSIIGLFTKK